MGRRRESPAALRSSSAGRLLSSRTPAQEAVSAVWRIESAAITAALTRRTGDFALAEDLAQEAFAAALEQWPTTGIPARPGAWLQTVAQRRLVDHARRRAVEARVLPTLGRAEGAAPDMAEEVVDEMTMMLPGIDSPIDDKLRLLFLCCHPSLPRTTQVVCTLRFVGGLQTAEIARSLLAAESTVAQRLVRAKRTLRSEGARFEVAEDEDIAERLGSVMSIIYAIFTEGHAATSGDGWTRVELCHDALRLARRLQHFAPHESEVHGLAALLELQSARLPARADADGRPVLLDDQDRSRWDGLLTRRGLLAIDNAHAVLDAEPGPYLLQAVIATCHAVAGSTGDTDWSRIAATYDELYTLHSSPVVALNAAVARVRANGPERGLLELQDLAKDPLLAQYPYLYAALADTHERSGHAAEARDAYLTAARVATTAALRDLFTAKAGRLDLG